MTLAPLSESQHPLKKLRCPHVILDIKDWRSISVKVLSTQRPGDCHFQGLLLIRSSIRTLHSGKWHFIPILETDIKVQRSGTACRLWGWDLNPGPFGSKSQKLCTVSPSRTPVSGWVPEFCILESLGWEGVGVAGRVKIQHVAEPQRLWWNWPGVGSHHVGSKQSPGESNRQLRQKTTAFHEKHLGRSKLPSVLSVKWVGVINWKLSHQLGLGKDTSPATGLL